MNGVSWSAGVLLELLVVFFLSLEQTLHFV